MAVQQEPLDALSTEHLGQDLRGRSVRGGLLNLVSQGSQFLIQTCATVVLARLLTPSDFGLVAMVATITGLAQAFADLGLSEATIQRKEINQHQVSALFWINLAIGMGLLLLTVAVSPVLAKFYRDARLINITLISSLTFLIGGLRVQPDALLKRQMRFLALAIRDISSYALAVPLAIAMAWRGAGCWSLVALPLMVNFTQMTLSWLMVNWRPSLPRRDPGVGSMISFGGNVAASYFVITVTRSADNILIGRYLGPDPLGLYSRAYNLLMLPVRQLIMPAGSVAIPTLSRLQDDPGRFARYYLRAVNLLTWISAPVFAFMFVSAQPVIVLLLGKQWKAAAPVFQFLAISALGQVLLETIIWLSVSRGRSIQLFSLLLVVSPVLVLSYAAGLPLGIKGVALSGSLVLLALLPLVLKFAFRETELSLPLVGRAVVYPLALSVLAVIIAEMGRRIVAPSHIFSELLVGALAFVAVFSASWLVPPIHAEIISLRKLLNELRPSASPA
jgi:PST family polysaccharide transporter